MTEQEGLHHGFSLLFNLPFICDLRAWPAEPRQQSSVSERRRPHCGGWPHRCQCRRWGSCRSSARWSPPPNASWRFRCMRPPTKSATGWCPSTAGAPAISHAPALAAAGRLADVNESAISHPRHAVAGLQVMQTSHYQPCPSPCGGRPVTVRNEHKSDRVRKRPSPAVPAAC